VKILAINPALDSTKIALYENYDPIWIEIQSYEASDLEKFPNIISQEDFRVEKLKELLESKGERLSEIQAFVSVGGRLHPIDGGTYLINIDMLQDLLGCEYGESPSNLGAALAIRLASIVGSRYTYVVDPPVVDEMSETAHITGLPEVSRRSVFNALNQRAVAYREAANLGKDITECNFIVCNLDDTVSIGAHSKGKVVDVNDTDNASGAMSLRQSGDIPPAALVDLCFSGRYTKEEIKARLLGSGGFMAHLGVDDFEKIVKQVRGGDRKSYLVFEAFIYNVAKHVGACAAVLKGEVDAILLTGKIAANEYFCMQLSNRIGWIGPVVAYPGEDDTLALVEGVMRVMRGIEEAKVYA
jgi:butyrate kinase